MAADNFFTFTLLSVLSLITSSKVPLLVWEKDSSKIQPILSGHSVDLNHVFDGHVKNLLNQNQNVLIFVQDELSVDDFTKYTTSFEFLKRFNDIKNPLVFPDVKIGTKRLGKLIREFKSVNDVLQEDIDDWKFNNTPGIYLFHLEPVAQMSEGDKKDIFQRNDQLFHKTVKKVEKETSNFAVIYTSNDASKMVSELLSMESTPIEHQMKRRDASAHESKGKSAKVYNNNDCVLMYFTSIRFGADKANLTELIDTGFTLANSSCSPGINSISISLKEAKDNVKAFTMRIVIISKESLKEWYCKNITLKGNIDGKDFDETAECGGHYDDDYQGFPFNDLSNKKEIIVPLDMSYSCSKLLFNTTNYFVQLGNFQLQPRYNKDIPLKKFSGAYDCSGFFTLPILTGIFVGVILLLGLFFGIMMMMAIQTPELFDDPKGQTISVPTQE